MDRADRQELIARYEAGFDAVHRLVQGVDDATLDRRPSPQDWTAREVVHHLADSEMTSAIRLRMLLVADAPVIYGYDENAFAQRLRYGTRPIGPSLEAFRAARETTAQLLADLTDEEWARSGWHTESGPYSVEAWLRTYAAHAFDHAAQIEKALGA